MVTYFPDNKIVSPLRKFSYRRPCL